MSDAGVNAPDGFTVKATRVDEADTNSGAAGGFAGYASGAQISNCNVRKLAHVQIADPDDLEAEEIDEYYDSSNPWSVDGIRYAGGFAGRLDIGSTASVGSGLSVLGDTIQLNDLLTALNVMVSTVEHSDVEGTAGGYVVRATDSEGQQGYAGGYAGRITGAHIQDCNAQNFSHIVGRIAAGGYTGSMEPGSVAEVLGDDGETSILNKLLNITDLASLVQTFVPTIRNSSTDAVPCGGVVRAQAASSDGVQRGMAGGYVGHNEGGSIWGLNTDPWKTATDPYNGTTSLCKAERIRSVYGAEYAGGYTGFMEAADTASAGGLSLLGGLIKVDNLLGVLSIVYPTQENTAVYGPLANLDVNTWNSWVQYVGQYGGYGYELAQSGTVQDQNELDAKLADYIYGYNVVAGRQSKGTNLPNPGGDAGGYVGLMRSGTLTNCMAYDVNQVQAWSAAGGYAGRMETGGAAQFGSVDILGGTLSLQLSQLIQVAQVFVPAVRNSSVQGYTSGMTVTATGTPNNDNDVGYAGGFVGAAYGAQIQIEDSDLPNNSGDKDSVTWTGTDKYPAPTASCDVRNLRRVTGRSSIGGYVGLATAASLAQADTNAVGGLLQGVLDAVLKEASSLVNLVQATVTVIRQASVSPADTDWGFVVDGQYGQDGYAPYAGGSAGQLQAAFLGKDLGAAGEEGDQNAETRNLTVTGLRQVDGGLYAGGFVGLGDVGAVAQVGDTNTAGESNTTILGGLLGLGQVDALDVLRSYVYHADVTGVAEGYRVEAHSNPQPGSDTGTEGTLSETRYAGCAGGFAGGMMNGTVLDCNASNVATVKACNYTGGFIGHMGKSGAVDVDDVSVLGNLLGVGVGALDLFGTQVKYCELNGYSNGLQVIADGGQQPIAGGFAGYGDLGRIDDSKVDTLKKVTSDQIAGGFIGKTDMAYLVSLEADSPLVNALLVIVNKLLEALYVDDDKLEDINLVNLNLGILKVEVLEDGNALRVVLLGLPITVALSKANAEGGDDVVIITIGDSVIRLPCHQNQEITQDDLKNVEINLIKGNRTEVDACTVTGVANGYDVFGGGATQDQDGAGDNGIVV